MTIKPFKELAAETTRFERAVLHKIEKLEAKLAEADTPAKVARLTREILKYKNTYALLVKLLGFFVKRKGRLDGSSSFSVNLYLPEGSLLSLVAAFNSTFKTSLKSTTKKVSKGTAEVASASLLLEGVPCYIEISDFTNSEAYEDNLVRVEISMHDTRVGVGNGVRQ